MDAGKLDRVQHASGQCTSSYLIQQNDNLQNLAVKYLGTTDYSQLLAANPWIKDPNAIVAGTHLNIPPCSTSLGEPCLLWPGVLQPSCSSCRRASCAPFAARPRMKGEVYPNASLSRHGWQAA